MCDVFGSVGCSSASPDCKDRLFPASLLQEESAPWAAATARALKAGLPSWLPVCPGGEGAGVPDDTVLMEAVGSCS